jgi:hypothetical protein
MHGILDYILSIILLSSPWLFGFSRNGAETWIPLIIGGSAVGYSLFTNDELGVMKLLPMGTHLTIDFLSGLFLVLSPWLFAFADVVYWPHVILGILEAGLALITQRIPRKGNTFKYASRQK